MPIEQGKNAAISWGYCCKCGSKGDIGDDLRAEDAICRGCGGDGDGNPLPLPDTAYSVVFEGPEQGREKHGFYLGLAKRNEPGYHQLKPGYGPYEIEAAARLLAREMNEKIGHTERTAADVVTSSIAAQVRKESKHKRTRS